MKRDTDSKTGNNVGSYEGYDGCLFAYDEGGPLTLGEKMDLSAFMSNLWLQWGWGGGMRSCAWCGKPTVLAQGPGDPPIMICGTCNFAYEQGKNK